jgi:hypothetical protein
VIFNATSRWEATHYVVVTNDTPLFAVETNRYNCGTATSDDWQPLAAPATNETVLSTGPFALLEDSAIDWTWGGTNVYLALGVQGSGMVDRASQWVVMNSNVTVTGTALEGYDFQHWSGDTNGCTVASNTITLAMSQARTVTAVFSTADEPYSPRGTPYTWLEQYFAGDYDVADTNDTDGDGMLTWQEYVTGTDPTSPSSVFAVIGQVRLDGSNAVTWYATADLGATNRFSMNRSTNAPNQWILLETNAIEREASGTNTWWDLQPPDGNVPVFYRPSVIWSW